MIVDKNGKEIKKGSRVRFYDKDVGIVVGTFPQDPQGFTGAITIDVGGGCREYVAPSLMEVLDDPKNR